MQEVDITKLTPDVRYLDNMREVLADRNFAKNSPNLEMYFMYRKVKKENGLVNNITVTPAQMLGFEFNKTKGHSHIGDFQDIYTTQEGKAIYLMQTGNEEKK